MKRCIVLSVAVVVLFSAAIIMPVMAGDDSPQEVYARYISASRDGDLEKICKYVSDGKAQQIQSLSGEKRRQLAEKMKRLAPSEYNVTKEQINGIHATLFLSGKSATYSGGFRGKARFIKEGGEWKLEKEMWK